MESERLVAIWQAITTWVNEALAFFYQPSQLAQLGAVLVCGGLALAADRATKRAIETQARRGCCGSSRRSASA